MVLAEHEADARAEPASLTKIMTAYVAADALEDGAIALTDKTTVSEKAWRMEGSRMFIEVDTQVTVEELLQGVIVQSGNDASVALAEHVSGSEDVFATVMNQHAKRLGLKNTNFANSTGWPDPETYSTARDLTALSRALIRDHPDIYQRFADSEYSYGGIRQANRNRLLERDDTVDGVKTGHTEAAGYCLVSSAKRGSMRLVAAIMGADSDEARTKASQALLNYGYRFFESRALYPRDEVVATRKVWKGDIDAVELSVAADVYATFPRGRFDDIEAVAEVSELLIAPIEQGQALGELTVRLDDKDLRRAPLIAKHAVAPGSFISRAIDDVLMRFE